MRHQVRNLIGRWKCRRLRKRITESAELEEFLKRRLQSSADFVEEMKHRIVSLKSHGDLGSAELLGDFIKTSSELNRVFRSKLSELIRHRKFLEKQLAQWQTQ